MQVAGEGVQYSHSMPVMANNMAQGGHSPQSFLWTPAAGGAARTFFVRTGAASAFFVRNGERSERPGGFGERNERFFEDFCAGCWFLRAPRRTFFVKTRRAEHFL